MYVCMYVLYLLTTYLRHSQGLRILSITLIALMGRLIIPYYLLVVIGRSGQWLCTYNPSVQLPSTSLSSPVFDYYDKVARIADLGDLNKKAFPCLATRNEEKLLSFELSTTDSTVWHRLC